MKPETFTVAACWGGAGGDIPPELWRDSPTHLPHYRRGSKRMWHTSGQSNFKCGRTFVDAAKCVGCLRNPCRMVPWDQPNCRMSC